MSLSLPSRSSPSGPVPSGAARRLRHAARRATARLTVVLTLAAGAGLVAVTATSPASAASIGRIVPAPVSAQPSATTYTLPPDARVQTQAGSAQAAGVGAYLAGVLRRSTGYALPVTPARGAPSSGISLLLTGAPETAGEQGYQLDVTAKAVVIRARTPNGLFNGVQTLRQLLPAEIESATARPGPWVIPGGRVVDHPRFAYRGAMLDVARHFHPVETVKRYIDRIALYKINYLHLHLTDDQGWRIAVDGWPRLATYGGSTQVGGGPGGYYTKADYKEIVAYAAQRFVTIVPEIDLPGHTNAALASYAELNCDGVAPPLYTGIRVGFSSLCTSKEETYTFVKDVLTELAAITPGPYLHIGGDEAHSTPAADYAAFMNRVQPMVAAAGKTAMGWHQMGAPAVGDVPGRVLQYWGTTASDATVSAAVARGAKVVLSPANKAYIDMKYDASTPLGLSWAGYVEVQTAYDWNPGAYLAGVPESSVLGVEAPLWTETLLTEEHIEYMAFPRLPAIAELGWSPWSTHDWEGFRARLGAQAPRWTVMGIDFYRSPQVVWSPGAVTHEAEDATVSKAAVRADHPGYSGSGYVDYTGGKGAYVQWDVAAAEAGWATLRVRYANGGRDDRPLTIEVNGRTVARRLAFPPTGSWSSWRTRTLTVNLPAGTSTVRATAAGRGGGPNVDLLEARF